MAASGQRCGEGDGILSGKKLAKDIRKQLAEELTQLKDEHPNFQPGLTIVQVGGREDSNVYIRMKTKAANEVGIHVNHLHLPRECTEGDVLSTIHSLNKDPSVHAVLLQLPLDSDNPIDSEVCTNFIAVEKDVDGLTETNAGRLARGEMTNCLVPCTPLGCLEMIKATGEDVEGKLAVVLGRSKIVGSPMSDLLRWNHATVTVCHSRTRDLPSHTRQADILVVGIRQPKLVKKDWVKQGAIVIDVGINAIPDPTKKSGQALVGDVDYQSVNEVASWVTPVPGGVGPMTVEMVVKNTLNCAKKTLTPTQTTGGWGPPSRPWTPVDQGSSTSGKAAAGTPKKTSQPLPAYKGSSPLSTLDVPKIYPQGHVNMSEGGGSTSVAPLHLLGAHFRKSKVLPTMQRGQGPLNGTKALYRPLVGVTRHLPVVRHMSTLALGVTVPLCLISIASIRSSAKSHMTN